MAWILAHGDGLDELVVLASGMALALAVRLLVAHRRTPTAPRRPPVSNSSLTRLPTTTTSTFDEAMYVPSGGLAISGGTRRATSSGVVVTGPTAAAQRAPAVIRH